MKPSYFKFENTGDNTDAEYRFSARRILMYHQLAVTSFAKLYTKLE
jgi:hypothetical protein